MPARWRCWSASCESAPSRHLLFESAGQPANEAGPAMLGAAYRMQRAFGPAERVLKTVINAFPDDCESWFNLGLVYLDQARGPELEALVERLSQIKGGARAPAADGHVAFATRRSVLAGRIIDDLIAAEPKHTSRYAEV